MSMTKTNSLEKYISTLDTNLFGFIVAKTDFSGMDPETAISEFKKLDIKLVISRIEGTNIELLNKLEDLGFRVKDNQLTYRFELNDFKPDEIKLTENYNIREATETDIPALVKFTEESFAGYGHYFADKRLDEKKCMKIYKDWIKRSCEDKNVADKVFVAEIDGKAAGCLTFKIFEKNNSKYAAGGLGSVSKHFRNKSIFRAIALHGLKWGAEIGLDWEEHNVLTTNNSVNRSFSKLGFRIVNSYITLHGWL
jgi:hypothetical protein